MDIDYGRLENEISEALEKHPIWVLSTSRHDHVTSRSMSIVHIGLDIYFQSNQCYVKHEQMRENPQVALCCQNVSIEGGAQDIGDWSMPENAAILALYKARHEGSYKAYGSLDGQRVYRVTPTKVKLWKYENGEPFREILWVDEHRAERLDFM